MLYFDWRIWNPGMTFLWSLDESIKEKLWRYWFQRKRISTSWIVTTKHIISCSGSVWDGLRCNRWIASNDLFREKCLLTIVESHKKDHTRPRTKWRKTSESAYPTNVLGSIVLTLSLFKILNNNMFVVIYVSCYQLHWFDINKVKML